MGNFTNFSVSYDTNRVGFLKEGDISYYFENLKLIDVELLTNDFVRNSIFIKIDNIISNSVVFRIKSFETSDFKIPPFYVKVIEKEATNIHFIPEITIKVTPVSIKSTNKQPIEEIYNFFDPLWFIIPSILIVSFALGYFFYMFFRGREKQKIKETEIEVDPVKEFEEQIKKIKDMELTSKNYKEIFTIISEAVRKLLGRKLEFNALEMASSEIINYLKNLDSLQKDEFLKIVSHIFKLCDRVKFAKHIPVKEEKESCISECEELLKFFIKEDSTSLEVEK